MTPPYFWKALPTPVRGVLRPWLLVSLALHALVLFLPLLPDTDAIEPDEIVQLTPAARLPSPTPRLTPPPSPSAPPVSVRPSPVASPAPVRVQPPLRQAPVLTPRPVVVSPSPSPAPQPTPAATPSATPLPTPSPTPTPAAPTETPAAIATPSPDGLPSPSPTPSPDVPFADFPHLEGAEPGCGATPSADAADAPVTCWQLADSQWRTVSQSVIQALESNGYELTAIELASETGRRLYAVSQEGEVKYYLALVSTLNGTRYQLTPERPTEQQLDELADF